MVLLAFLAVVALTGEVSLGGPWGMTALGGLLGLAAWQGISGTWALEPARATTAMNQTLLYAAAFALVLIGVRGTRDLRLLIWAALIGSAVVTAYATGARLLPGVVPGDEHPRLSDPISYWNGLGALVAFGALLAIGLAGDTRTPRWARAATAGLVPMFLLALLLTYSRGSAATLVIGLAVLVALAPGRLETLAAALTGIAVSVPLLGAANGSDGIAALSGELPPHAAEGARILLLLLATMIASAAASLGAALGLARLTPRGRRLSGVAAGILVIVALATVLVAKAPSAGPVGWTKAQIDSFKTFDTGARSGAESVSDRLAVAAGSGRWQNWTVAAEQFRESPLVGTGGGDYVFFWQQNRPVDLTVVNAHSVYLEALGETGIVGLLLLVTPLAAAIAAFGLHTRKRRPPDEVRLVGIALAAAALVAVHAAGDWDWQIPAVILPAIALGAGALAVMGRRDDGRPRFVPAPARWSIAAAAVAGILLVSGPTASAGALDEARTAASGGDLGAALEYARDAAGQAPQDPAPRLLEANLLNDLGRFPQADVAFAAAVARSPADWEIFADWAAALDRRGDDAGARATAERAHALNPMEQRPSLILEGLASR